MQRVSKIKIMIKKFKRQKRSAQADENLANTTVHIFALTFGITQRKPQ